MILNLILKIMIGWFLPSSEEEYRMDPESYLYRYKSEAM